MRLCPLCNGKLIYVDDGEVGSPIMPSFYRQGQHLDYVMHAEDFIACTECEFCERVSMAGTTTRDLEALDGKPPAVCGEPPVAKETSDEEMSEILSDLLDARSLLKRSAVLFNYASDPVLVKQLTKKERDAMDRLADMIDKFIDGTEIYEE